MTDKEITGTSETLTSLVVEKHTEAAKKPSAKKNTGKNRRKSRELVMKAVYRGMLNQSELGPILRDMAEDPDYNKPKYGVDGKPILDSSGNQTYETKTVQYEATEPAHTSNPSAIGPCYNYVLTAKIKNLQKHYIDADSTIDVYASVDSAKQDSDYPQTKSVDNTIWQITELIADPDFLVVLDVFIPVTLGV